MKVILKKDIPNVGQAGHIKSVSDGYARNFLLPRQLAAVATPAAIARAEHDTTRRAQQASQRSKQDETVIKKLAGAVLVFREKANDAGHLFASVNASAIAKCIRQTTGLMVEDDAIQLDQPIKQIGRRAVTVKYAGQAVECIVDVQAKQ